MNKYFLNQNRIKNIGRSWFRLGAQTFQPVLRTLLLHGLNLNARRVSRKRREYMVDVHRAEIFFVKEPMIWRAKSLVFKRRLVFLSYNKQLINDIFSRIVALCRPVKYTGKGIFADDARYVIKQGKQQRK